MTLELVISIGLQGAGKTSFYQARFADTDVFAMHRCWNCRTKPKL